MPTQPGSLMAHLAQAPPRLLYHYTSLGTLMHILEKGTVRASDGRYLNDSTEYTFFLDLVQARIREMIKVETAERRLRLESVLAILENNLPEAFIACFSEKRDDLSQWRGYTSPGTGVCIGFNSASITNMIFSGAQQGASVNPLWARAGVLKLVKVLYIDSAYSGDMNRTFEQFYAQQDETFIPKSSILAGVLLSIAPFYKSKTFDCEKEWRIILNPRPGEGDFPGLDFREGKSTLIPFSDISIPNTNGDFISEIVVGPTPNMNLSVTALKGFLKLKKFEHINVIPSDVPYRPW